MSNSLSNSVIPSSSSSRSIQLEPYDSPERSRNSQTGYASGGGDRELHRELDAEEDEEGDLGFHSRRSLREKGKGKMRDQRIAGVQEENEEEERELDQEAEERKIQENLAKWSKADSKRRASIRKSNQTRFVTPNLPSPPPLPPVPSASTIIRRTSTMIRKNTLTRKGRRSQGNNFEGTGNDDEEDGGIMELRSSTGSGASRLSMSRKGRRKESLVLDQGRDGIDPDSVFELPSPTFTSREEDTPPISPSLPLVSSPTTSNPFSPVTSPARPSTLRTGSRISTTSGSRFIEDLEPVPSTTNESSPRSSTSTNHNPFSPPITPTKNPFSDHSHSHSHSESIDSNSTPRPQFHSRPSSSSTIESYQSRSTINGNNRLEPSIAETTNYDARRPLKPLADQSEQNAPPFFREPIMSPSNARSSRPARALEEDEEEDDEEGERNEVGLFDWLLCGCFRTRESRTDEGGWEQQGRTNPNE